MKTRTIWIIVNCLIITAFLLVSCTPAVTEEEKAATPEEEAVVEEEGVARFHDQSKSGHISQNEFM